MPIFNQTNDLLSSQVLLFTSSCANAKSHSISHNQIEKTSHNEILLNALIEQNPEASDEMVASTIEPPYHSTTTEIQKEIFTTKYLPPNPSELNDNERAIRLEALKKYSLFVKSMANKFKALDDALEAVQRILS